MEEGENAEVDNQMFETVGEASWLEGKSQILDEVCRLEAAAY